MPHRCPAEAMRKKYPHLGETLRAPVDEPIMTDGPGAWPPLNSGGFGLYRAGETPPLPEQRACPRCGHPASPQAKFCTQCGAKLR